MYRLSSTYYQHMGPPYHIWYCRPWGDTTNMMADDTEYTIVPNNYEYKKVKMKRRALLPTPLFHLTIHYFNENKSRKSNLALNKNKETK